MLFNTNLLNNLFVIKIEFYFDDFLSANIIYFKGLTEAVTWLKINLSNSLFNHIDIKDLELVSISISVLTSNLSLFLKDVN